MTANELLDQLYHVATDSEKQVLDRLTTSLDLRSAEGQRYDIDSALVLQPGVVIPSED